MSTGKPRPFVPVKFQCSIFNSLHQMSHPSVRATQKLVAARYVWPGINFDVCQWAAHVFNASVPICIDTQLLLSFLSPFPIFIDNIHINLVRPLPTCQGYTYILSCIGRFTCWPEAIPITNITAETVAEAFVTRWIACFGVPSTVTTDGGSLFESTLLEHLVQLLGVKYIQTTAYHPMSNGLVERLHHQPIGLVPCPSLYSAFALHSN